MVVRFGRNGWTFFYWGKLGNIANIATLMGRTSWILMGDIANLWPLNKGCSVMMNQRMVFWYGVFLTQKVSKIHMYPCSRNVVLFEEKSQLEIMVAAGSNATHGCKSSKPYFSRLRFIQSSSEAQEMWEIFGQSVDQVRPCTRSGFFCFASKDFSVRYFNIAMENGQSIDYLPSGKLT